MYRASHAPTTIRAQPVIKAEGGQAVADADNPGQVINDDDGGIHGNLRADGPVRAEIQTAVKQLITWDRTCAPALSDSRSVSG